MTKLSYELALELKKAGWKQPASWTGLKVDWTKNEGGDDFAYAPELSELIEACPKILPHGWTGARFTLRWEEDKSRWEAGYIWQDGQFNHEHGHGSGQTPAEAVARLWLKLQAQSDKAGNV